MEEPTLAAEKHPYASPGAITAAISQFRKSFPTPVNADTLRKLGIAPNNESYVLNTLRFVGVIDGEGNKTAEATSIFNQHEDSAFKQAFGGLVKNAYKELFDLHGEDAWTLPLNSLISFFRNNDQTSDVVGRRQASTFQVLSALCGYAELQEPKTSGTKPKAALKGKTVLAKAKVDKQEMEESSGAGKKSRGREVGLTVRIEVNLPTAADQETYDRIFRSIRENLLHGN